MLKYVFKIGRVLTIVALFSVCRQLTITCEKHHSEKVAPFSKHKSSKKLYDK
jgi:hypothetical protein